MFWFKKKNCKNTQTVSQAHAVLTINKYLYAIRYVYINMFTIVYVSFETWCFSVLASIVAKGNHSDRLAGPMIGELDL